MGEMRGKYKILIVTSEDKQTLGRPRCRGHDNMRIDRKEKQEEGVDIWFKIGSSCGLFQRTFGFHKRRLVSSVVGCLLTSVETFCVCKQSPLILREEERLRVSERTVR
jgi:hypothetical protein